MENKANYNFAFALWGEMCLEYEKRYKRKQRSLGEE
jgi:hypothetical protein